MLLFCVQLIVTSIIIECSCDMIIPSKREHL